MASRSLTTWALCVAALSVVKLTDAKRTLSEEFAAIAGYAPGSNITEHNKIDLDQAAMETELAAFDWAGATQVYTLGGNSVSKGSYRTLQGFSTGAEAKMYNGCP